MTTRRDIAAAARRAALYMLRGNTVAEGLHKFAEELEAEAAPTTPAAEPAPFDAEREAESAILDAHSQSRPFADVLRGVAGRFKRAHAAGVAAGLEEAAQIVNNTGPVNRSVSDAIRARAKGGT